MERIFKKIISILNNNEVFHSINQEAISQTEYRMVDVYSVNLVVPNQSNTPIRKRSKKTQKHQDAQFALVPILQVKYIAETSSLQIFLNNECIYNNTKFSYTNSSVGFVGAKQKENQSLKRILDICKRKSTIVHLDYLNQAKQLLKEQRQAFMHGFIK